MINWQKKSRTAFMSLALALLLFPLTGRAQGQSQSHPDSHDGGASIARIANIAAEDSVLTLGDAVLLALKHQPRLRAARERVKAQGAVVGQALSAYYPTVNWNSSFSSTTQSGRTSTSQRAFDDASSRTNVDWTIYDFGRREGGVQQERDSLDSRRFAKSTSVEAVVLDVKRAYYRYLQVKVLVRVRVDTVTDREALVRQARGFFEVGTRPKIEVARAESNLFSAKADLISAQNGVKIAWAELKNAMGLADFSVRPLAEEALLEKPVETLAKELAIRKPAFSLAEARETAFALRPELKDFAAQRRAQDSAIAVARRGHLPNLNFSGSYGRRQTSRRRNGGIISSWNENWSVGLNVTVPIFTGFQTTYEVEEGLRNYHEIKALEEQSRQQIALDVERGYLNVIASGERIRATEAAVRSAKENLDLANGRYRVGVGSIIEITEAQVLNTEAQTNHVQAITDYKIFEAELAKAMGQGIAR